MKFVETSETKLGEKLKEERKVAENKPKKKKIKLREDAGQALQKSY